MTDPMKAQVRAFLHGLISGWLHSGAQEYIKIVDLDQQVNSDGSYHHYTDVTTESGVRLRVSVEVLEGGRHE